MRRPQPAFGLVAVMSSLLVAVLFATPASAASAPVESEAAPVFSAISGQCTKWTSQFVPPKTIRVLRTRYTDAPNKVRGTVQKVDFHDYVATVMAAEWPERYPLETIKAGAVAVKQYAWYYILNPRGLTKWVDGKKRCYDVVDSTADQFYKPETKGPGKKYGPAPDSPIFTAMDATWDVSLRKYKHSTDTSRMFLTGYRDGSSSAACGADATGFKLFHRSTRKCGEDGLKFREILRLYLKPNLEIVQPGRKDIIGTKHGDASAMRRTTTQLTANVWTPERTAPEPGSNAGISLSTDALVDYASGDMNGDGREDLVWLKKTGAREGKIKVALSGGTNYGAATEWWAGNTVVPLNEARLLVGDFFANQRTDVAILSKGETAGTSRLVVLRRKEYGRSEKFAAPVQWWSGTQDYGKIAGAWLGDLSGDGRADLIIRKNPDTGGVALKTAVTKSPPGSSGQRMHSYKARFVDSSLKAAKVRMTVTDANRDGRDDVFMVVGGSGNAKVERLQGQKAGGFFRMRIWTAPRTDPVPVGKTRLGTADIDYDGRGDLIFYSATDNGTRIRTLKARYTSMKQGPDWRIGADWTDVRPY